MIQNIITLWCDVCAVYFDLVAGEKEECPRCHGPLVDE
jgi:hypothetical protein